MEPLFSNQTGMSKTLCRDFGVIMKRKNKLSLVPLIGGLLLLFLYFPVMNWIGADNISYVILVGLLLIVWYIFLDSLNGAFAFKSISKQLRNSTISYLFYEDAFCDVNSLGQSQFSYSIIEKIVVSDDVLALFVSKSSAHLLSRDAFVGGSAEEFIRFLAEKTGKPVCYIRGGRSFVRKWIALGIILLVFLLVLFGTNAMKNMIL